MTALSAFRAKSAEKYQAMPLEFDDGTSVILKSIMDLTKDELKLFNDSQKRLQKSDESDDLEEVRSEFVSALAGVSSDKAATAAALDQESLGVLTQLFEAYASSLSEGAKSPGDK
jgi:hypothetical protein